MSLVHGQNISAQDIEHELSRWDAVLFARLGNAVAWANTWEHTPTIPAFTERVNVADNGVDGIDDSSTATGVAVVGRYGIKDRFPILRVDLFPPSRRFRWVFNHVEVVGGDQNVLSVSDVKSQRS